MRLFFFFFFVAAMLSLPSLAKRWTYGFRIAKMQLEFPYHPEWEVPPNPDIHTILKQPFRFLGKGAQCYAFESQDGQYVVKLFRYSQPPVPSKVIALFNACKIAYDALREETGLIYLHLNPTPLELPTLYCKDAIGRSYAIPLDACRFAIQKKATPFRRALGKASQNPLEMKQRIDAFLALLRARTAKKIANTDSNLSRNFGFLGDRAIELDFGNYRFCPNLDPVAEQKRYTNKLRSWLQKYDPAWIGYLDQQTEALR